MFGTSARVTVGIDIGGTTVKALRLDGQGKHSELQRCGTGSTPTALFDSLLLMIDRVSAGRPVDAVGIGTPGLVSPGGVISGRAVNINGWDDIALRVEIQKRLAVPVTVKNDVTMAAYGEYVAGQSANGAAQTMIFLSIGTGIGGGIVINGDLYEGPGGMAGEFGHMVVERDGAVCSCGGRGCLERYASASGLMQRYRERRRQQPNARPHDGASNKDAAADVADNGTSGSVGSVVGDDRCDVTDVTDAADGANKADVSDVTDVAELYRRVELGSDACATAVHLEACDRLAQAIGTIIHAFNPQSVVLGGGVMQSAHLIIPAVTRCLPRYCLPTMLDQCRIVKARLGELSGAYGAARCAADLVRFQSSSSGG